MSSFAMPNRRHFLKHAAGAAAIAVPGLSFVQQLKAAETAAKKANKSLIIVWLGGGASTIDMWDLKPGSPNGGELKPRSTAASGVQISELLPTIGSQMKNASVIRSLTTTEGDHNRGTTLMNTGHSPSPLVDYPHIGAIAAQQLTPKDLDLPSFISVGGTAQRIGPGFLGMTYAAFTVQNPGQPPENIRPPEGVAGSRMERRGKLFEALEGGVEGNRGGYLRTGVKDDALKAHRDVYGKALSLVVSSRKQVFSLDSSEDRALIEQYGNNNFGRGCLLARKLTEAGAVCVEVDLGGWDMHNGIFAALGRNLPTLDKGLGMLLKDLADRGRLKDTVVCCMGEFGRTPRINQNGGRDHWARCWSVLVAGGNIKGGIAYGSTSDDGTEVKDNPVKIGDLFATLYKGMGLDPETQIRDNLGRPMAIAGENAKPIAALVS